MNDSQTNNLPISWALSPLSDVAAVNPKLDKADFVDSLEVSFVPMPAVQAGTGEINVTQTRKFGEVKKGYTAFREGDVLFAKITPCMENGKMAVVPKVCNGVAFGSTEFHVVRARGGINARYIYHFISSQRFRYDAEHNMTGAVGQRRVPTAYLADHLIPIPPSAAQTRIVAKIENLFSELDKSIDNLATARKQLSIYRQAVLKHAFEGKLTANWRKGNKDRLASPKQCLFRIQAERVARYRQQLEDWKEAIKVWEAAGKPDTKPSKPRKPDTVHVEDVSLPALPEGWVWEHLGNLNTDVFDGPFGSNLKTSDYVSDGVRVIRLENIGYLKFIEDKVSYISEKKYEGLQKHTVRAGDIIFSSFVIDGIRLAILPDTIDRAVNKADCFCVRLHGETVRTDYAASFLSMRTAYKQIESEIHGIGRPRINTTQLKTFAIPLCSRAEQNELMSLLSEKLSLADNLDASIEREIEKCEALRQSILKKAFSGGLVEQDPNEEPASVLLERIKPKKTSSSQEATKDNRRNAA